LLKVHHRQPTDEPGGGLQTAVVQWMLPGGNWAHLRIVIEKQMVIPLCDVLRLSRKTELVRERVTKNLGRVETGRRVQQPLEWGIASVVNDSPTL